MNGSSCRFCGTTLGHSFVDLGRSPLSNAFRTRDQLGAMEPYYPLHVFVCERCLLVQLDQFETAETIFGDYLYFSSFSDTWQRHCATFADRMIQELALGAGSLVVEVASNDGSLLQYFQKSGVEVLGIEPAANVARVAEGRGVPTEVAFFGTEVARRLVVTGKSADLVCANNVLAHVPALNDFVAGLKILLKPGGTITVEFPHLLRLIEERQFDTMYHEHFSYFSLFVVERLFDRHGLRIFDVERLATHGGSLRIYACHLEDAAREHSERVAAVMADECAAGLHELAGYDGFAEAVVETKCQVLEFLIAARRSGKLVAGYGAPAKGSTLLNYCGIGPELIRFTVDRSPHKQGQFMPGVQIPILPPEHILAERPDYVFILPWNIKDEVMTQMNAVRDWGGRFVVPIPRLSVL